MLRFNTLEQCALASLPCVTDYIMFVFTVLSIICVHDLLIVPDLYIRL
jgi:hypothetical protein